ncbi:MAG: DUF5615 family PIN-like protein [Acidimicrobiia bacterium]|nr:DUF5615 family PIN-like protein [Acidimicrobiia bacterium]
MKLLVDAQLPARLARHLAAAGHDVVHTVDLPGGNRTPDEEIARRADAEDRIVVSKDRDFRDGHLLRGSPVRLLIVATGNITNDGLLDLLTTHLDAIVDAFGQSSFVELGPDNLVIHRDRPSPARPPGE